MNKLPCFTSRESKPIVKTICRENKIDVTLLEDLSERVQSYMGIARAHGINEDIADCIDAYIRRIEMDGE